MCASMSEEERLGRYILDRRLASGGMAEVFLARQSGPEGYERTCVVKRMLQSISDDEVFVRMFLDEARLAAQLTHPNIAQIYDFGEEDGVFFLAMEYVSGANLREVIEHQHRTSSFLPYPSVARIASDAARALAYAHDALGQDGEPLGIIHRDVSPHNILLSRGGAVKLIDFGIAKTTMASGRTGAGVIKGKYAYMAPEQVLGQPLDRRTDIYALGLVLYELLTNHRAIRGSDAQSMMTAAAQPNFQPISAERPDAPAAVLKVVERALAPAREQRYANAEQMSAELDLYLRTQAAVTDTGLATLLPPQTAEQLRRITSPSNRTRQETPRARSGSGRSPIEGKESITTPLGPLEPTFTAETTPSKKSLSTTTPQVKRRVPLIAGAASFVVVGGVVLAAYLLRPGAQPPPEPVPSPPVAVAVPPPLAPPPPPVATPTPSPPPATAPAPELAKTEPRHDEPVEESKHTGRAHERKRQTRVAAAAEHRDEAPKPKGVVDIRALPYAEVFLGDRSLGMTPFKPLELDPGHYRIRLVNGGRSETREVDVEPGHSVVVRVDLR
jgi:serine/threonine protein kinase